MQWTFHSQDTVNNADAEPADMGECLCISRERCHLLRTILEQTANLLTFVNEQHVTSRD
jgi:hypothetical protein